MLLAILALGLTGTAIDLVLLDHNETSIQLVPLLLIGLGLAVLIWNAMAESSSSLIALRVTMSAFIAAGILGIALHYKGSVEFQKEIDPSMQGFDLFSKAIRSKAPPALAPAIMAQLGLLGLVYTYPLKERGE
jgi:hypothetical protein